MVRRLLICGGGNGAHVFSGLAASQPDFEVRVLTLYSDEAERWRETMAAKGFKLTIDEHGKTAKALDSQPSLVTKDTKEAAEGADVVVITVPAFAHTTYLEALKEHISDTTVLVGLPGQAGFEFAVRGIFGKKADRMTVISFETLPWACRITTFGHAAEILGIKEVIEGSMNHSGQENPLPFIQEAMGMRPKLVLKGHIIGMTLMAVNAYIHPCIMYGQWADWDGQGLAQKPLFYHGVSREGCQLLSDCSDEILLLARTISQQHPEVDLSQVEHVHDWYKRCYPGEIEDNSSLYSCLRTNRAYDGLTHPVTEDSKGTFSPNYKFRYLTEDIPFGLAVIKGIAEIARIATPNIDTVLLWAQSCMGKEYVVEGHLKGRHISETRSPQAYGMHSMQEMLGLGSG